MLHQHVNVAEAVFVLYQGKDNSADPIGTAFAISDRLLLTACQNVVTKSADGESDNVTESLKVSPGLTRDNDSTIVSEERGKCVQVYQFNVAVDWACLKLDDNEMPFSAFIPLASSPHDIPPRGSTEKLYIYHCPIGLFLDDIAMETCHVMVKEASIGVIGAKTLSYQNGAFPGSCGGPYIFRNKAVALHTDSVSTTKTAQDIKDEATSQGRKRKLPKSQAMEMVVDSCVSNHTSLGNGIVLHVRSGIMNLLHSDP